MEDCYNGIYSVVLFSGIYPHRQDVHRGSIGTVTCTLEVSNMSNNSHLDMYSYSENVPISQNVYAKSFLNPVIKYRGPNVTLEQRFVSTDLPDEFSLVCGAHANSGQSIAPLRLSLQAFIHIQGMLRP